MASVGYRTNPALLALAAAAPPSDALGGAQTRRVRVAAEGRYQWRLPVGSFLAALQQFDEHCFTRV